MKENFRKPKNYWTKEKCISLALKFTNTTEFREEYDHVYRKIIKRGWNKEAFKNMKKKSSQPGYWTKSRCREAASQYSSRTEFKNNERTAYEKARYKKWLKDICSHMQKKTTKPMGYWTKERVIKIAKKYNNRFAFGKNEPSAYAAARRNGWLDQACSHMIAPSNLKKRALYSIEFSDNSVYVGLTCSYEGRKLTRRSHKCHIWQKQQKVDHKYLEYNVFMDEKEAQLEEKKLIQKYKNNNWTVLNKAKAGALGGTTVIYTKEYCANLAKKFIYIKDFRSEYPSAYGKALKEKWLEEICSHMKILRVPKHTYTKNYCEKVAKKFKTRKDLHKNHAGVCNAIYANGWSSECFSHMKYLNSPNGFWTKERILEEAKKYVSYYYFQINSPSAYNAARRINCLNDIIKKLPKKRGGHAK